MQTTTNLKNLWDKVLSEIELKISRTNFLTWFKNTRLLNKNDKSGVITIGVSTNFAKEWIENRYNNQILDILRHFDETISRIEYVVLKDTTEKIENIIKSKKNKKENPNQGAFETIETDSETNIHKKYQFKNFVVGSSNELAHAASLAVSKEVGIKYNPLFIYGDTGLGKTHLIQATGNEIIKNYRNRIKVKYITSEKFVNDVVWAIRLKKMDYIKNKYRTVDVLIVDDIQFIGGKERSEEEFFHTFNILYQNNKQIIISSDRAPSAIPILEDRLRSRFEGGMIVDITHPDYEMKLAIIKNKTEEKNFNISNEIINLIASKQQRSIREIEGIINKIYFYQQYKGEEIDLKTAKKIIEETSQQNNTNVNPSTIMKVVAKYFELSHNDIINKSRRKEVVVPRQIVMFLLRDMLGMSYPDIGEKVGKRDHTTAIHSYEKISAQIKDNRDLNQKIINIKSLINKKIYK